jgi:hypothetical protein
MAKPDFYVALENFIGTLKGEPVEIKKGDLVRATDPALKKWPEHFGPPQFREEAAPEVEQATAAPGEKRGA